MTESKLKICLVTSMHSWNDDRIFERTAIGLTSLGHDVSLVAPADKDMEVEGVRILSIPIRGRLGKHLLAPSEAYKRMIKVEADVYHFFNPNLLMRMKRWSQEGHNVFVDIHENYESRLDSLRFIPRFLKPIAVSLYRKYENRLTSNFKGVTVVTKSMADKIRVSGVPVLVVDNVPYLSRLKKVQLARNKAEVPTIITSGSHSDARNCMKAIEALPLIVKKIPDVKMIFVGRFQPKEYEQILIDRALELGVSENLETAGMLPWLENFERISSAHIGCVFYNDNLNNRVTLPNRLYEYMYCGMAVLGEDFPEVKSVLHETNAGRVVNSQKPAEIAAAAIELLKDKDLIEQLMNNARTAVLERYNFEQSLIKLNTFYHEKIY